MKPSPGWAAWKQNQGGQDLLSALFRENLPGARPRVVPGKDGVSGEVQPWLDPKRALEQTQLQNCSPWRQDQPFLHLCQPVADCAASPLAVGAEGV